MSTALTIASTLLAGALALLWLRHKGLAETLNARSDDLSSLLHDVRDLRIRQVQDHATNSGELARLQAALGEARERADALAAALTEANAKNDSLASALAATTSRAASLATSLDAERQRLDALGSDIDRHRQADAAMLSSALAANEQRLQQRLADEIGSIEKRAIAHDAERETRASAANAELNRLIGEATTSLSVRLVENEEKLRAIAEQTLVPEAAADDTGSTNIEALAARVDTLQAKQTADIERERTRLYTYLLNLSTINSSGFLGHRRHLSDAAVRDLIGGYVKALGLDYSKRQLAYLAHKVCLLEDRCVGRLATAIETILVRLLAARHLVATQDRLHVLEIGTLFGVGAGALYELNRLRTDDLELTLIDPLIGYYGAGEPDLITGEPVSRAALDINLERCAIPPSRVTVLQGMSEDPAIRAACSGRHFNMLIIDGDHSRAGVKRDFENYRDLVAPGGLIVFDDYDVKEWPDIKAYVDEEVAGRTDLELVGKGWRTALFRALAPPNV